LVEIDVLKELLKSNLSQEEKDILYNALLFEEKIAEITELFSQIRLFLKNHLGSEKSEALHFLNVLEEHKKKQILNKYMAQVLSNETTLER